MSKRSLQPILEQTHLLYEALSDLWDDLPAPDSQRSLLVAGFCEIVRQHALSQVILADAENDVTATTLVNVTANNQSPIELAVDGYAAFCDVFNAELAPLTSFILPGGTSAAALLHLARTVARRAERSAWALRQIDPDRSNPLAATYLNRLSDLLFILARVANPAGDVMWVPGGDRAGQQK